MISIKRLIVIGSVFLAFFFTRLPAAYGRQASAPCLPGAGWQWARGPEDPRAAARAQAALQQDGISATVRATTYGEVDACNTFIPRGVDLSLTLSGSSGKDLSGQAVLDAQIRNSLGRLNSLKTGAIRVQQPDGGYRNLTVEASLPPAPAKAAAAGASATLYSKHVLVVVYDPFIDAQKTTRLSDYLGWNDAAGLSSQLAQFFRASSNQRMLFQFRPTATLDEIPIKADGFQYSATDYIQLYTSPDPQPHPNDLVDYAAILRNPALDICGKANRGEIDEVWMFGGPWFGFHESILVGPNAYYYNSNPYSGEHTCQRLIPMMGLSMERGASEAVESFGHRMENTMRHAYQDTWEWNSTNTAWEKFALSQFMSPLFTYSGCGDIHHTPNSQSDYDWSNSNHPAFTFCDEFRFYPDMRDPRSVLKTVTCTAWGCDPINPQNGLYYFAWWFGHLPAASGCAPDQTGSDWWAFFASPDAANSPGAGCPLPTVTPSATPSPTPSATPTPPRVGSSLSLYLPMMVIARSTP